MQYALATGPISGPIPTPDHRVQGDTVDVTPDLLYFDTEEEAIAVAHAIEDEHFARGTHEAQLRLRQAQVAGDKDAIRAFTKHVADAEQRVKARAKERG